MVVITRNFRVSVHESMKETLEKHIRENGITAFRPKYKGIDELCQRKFNKPYVLVFYECSASEQSLNAFCEALENDETISAIITM